MKKKLPLELLYIIEHYFQGKAHLFNFDTTSFVGKLLRITEKGDTKSPFYFDIIQTVVSKKSNVIMYDVSYLPNSSEHLNLDVFYSHKESIVDHLDKWIQLLKAYNTKSTIFDDPILQSYYEEIKPTIKILDPDADSAPFNYRQQTLLVEMYDEMARRVEEEKNDTNLEEANAIILEIESAKASISKDTKNQAMERLAKVGAMGMKYSYYIAKLIAETWLVGQVLRMITGGAV